MRKEKYHIKTFSIGKKRKMFKVLTIFSLIFAFFIMYIRLLITPLMVDISSSQIKVYATKSMNYAITETMNQNISYDDLISIITDASGKIGMIQANTVKINNVSMMIERITLAHLLDVSRNPISIPLGAFTGISIFSNMGPPVMVDIFPYGDVTCRFLSQFIAAGINQTQHKIYVDIKAIVNVVLPFKTISVAMNNEVLVCESVIIGEIPETYLKANTLSDMVNLIP